MIRSIHAVLLVAFAMPVAAGKLQPADSTSVLASPVPQAKASGSTSLKGKANNQQIISNRAESAVDRTDAAKKSPDGSTSGASRTKDSVKKTLDQQQQLKAHRY